MANMRKRKIKFISISIFTMLIFGYLIYTGIRDTMTYYLTVPEVLAGTTEAQGDMIRVGGNVFPDSVKWNPKDLKLLFAMGDDSERLEVDFRGVVPDSFKPGNEVVVEGRYEGNGRFTATSIMPKCASKYE
jgi:cytochrome c-type biogenesis protein CcmE